MRWVELHAHSYFSFLDGACSPEELAEAAARFEMGALALTDHGGLYGAVRFRTACAAAGVRPAFGAEQALIDDWSCAADRDVPDHGDDDRPGRGGRGPSETALPRQGDVVDGTNSLASMGAPVASVDTHRVVLLARDRRGWSNLCALLSRAGQARSGGQEVMAAAALAASLGARSRRRDGRPPVMAAPPKGRGTVPMSALEGRTAGLVVLTAGLGGILAERLRAGDADGALARARWLVRTFGAENVRVEIWRHADMREDRVTGALIELADYLGLKLVATNVSHYARPEGRRLADVLTCIRTHRTLDEAGTLLKPSDRWALPSPEEMAELFRDRPDAVTNAGELAEELSFSLDDLSFALPEWPAAQGQTPYSELFARVQQGAKERYRPMLPAAARQIAHELDVIFGLGLAGYFLLVWDIVRFCRESGIRVQGRGSAANSAVCYCLGITAVDPVRMSLLFERFLSADRRQPPDIDLDIAHQDRERVIQYVYERHGRDHAAMVAEVICYRARLAVREAGKVLGLSVSEVDRIAACVGPWAAGGAVEHAMIESGFDPRTPRMRLLAEMCIQLEGVPRHMGIHVGGMIVTASPLCELVPVEDATMPGRTVIQWDKDDVAELGLAKIDLLGLGMLTMIGKAIDLVGQRGIEIEPANLRYDEPDVYDMLCAADTVGVFQVESRAQMVTLPRLRPRCFYDLVIEVALIRPGPIQGDMVHPYLRRRAGEEEVTYAHECVEPVLARTLGVPLFQEQGMRVAVAAAGFTAGEADELRRAMGAKRSESKMRALSDRLRAGMLARGFTAEGADTIIKQLTAFASYGFPESHAASFALLVYVSAHIKRYFPAEFTCALLNSQPMGFYAPATLVADARRHGVEVLAIDLGTSAWDSTIVLDGPGPDARARLQLGLRLIKGLGPAAHERLERARREGPFASLEDVVARSGLTGPVLERLATIGCFTSFGLERRQAVWQLQAALQRHALIYPDHPLAPADRSTPAPSAPPASAPASAPAPPSVAPTAPPALLVPEAWAPLGDDPLPLPPMGPLEIMASDYRAMGLSTGAHPVALLREAVRARGALTAAEVTALGQRIGNGGTTKRKGPLVHVAGLVISRQGPPTAKGFIFLTLEDETGFANIIVHPRIAERFRLEVMREPLLLVEGGMSIEGGTVNVMARKLSTLALDDPGVRFRGRDFK